jgi:hypothetical protein
MIRNIPAARIAFIASLVVLALVLVPVSLAAKGGGSSPHGGGGTTAGGGGGTLTLVLLDSTDGLAHWGQRITYNVSTTATTYPYVSTDCYQGATVVGTTSAGFFPSYAWPSAQIVPLKSQVWTSGPADCTAKLYSMDGGRQTILATINFHVYA